MNDKEFAAETMWDDCIEAAKLNIFNGSLVFIKTAGNDIFEKAGSIGEYAELAAEYGLIYPADLEQFLYHMEFNVIRRTVLVKKAKITHSFRIKTGDGFVWMTFEVMAPKSFSQDELRVILKSRSSQRRQA